MIDGFLKICKEYGVYSIVLLLILLLVYISPIFAYFILYQPDFIANSDYYITILTILIFSSCLFVIIYYFSLSLSTYEINKSNEKNSENINEHEEQNNENNSENINESEEQHNENNESSELQYLVIVNLERTALFMTFLTFIIVACHKINYKVTLSTSVTLSSGLIIPLCIIVIYMFYSIIRYIQIYKSIK